MRLLVLSPTLEVAGAERIAVDLARHVATRGHDVALVAPPGPLEDELAAAGIARLHVAGLGRSPLGVATAAVSVARAIRARRPTVVHAHNPRMAAVARTARLLAGGGPPLLTTFHGGRVEGDRAAARLLRSGDRLVCVDDDLRDRMVAHGCAADRTEVILNGVGPALAPDDPLLAGLDAELGRDGPTVAVVGSLVAVKAVDRAIRATRLVIDAVPTARLLVVGDGPERTALEALATSLGLGAHVRFLGVRRDARAVVQRATVVVSTSRSEGLSLAALETLRAGTPLVAPDVGGMRRLLGGGAGVLLADTRPPTVAAAVVDLLRRPDVVAAMGRAGRALTADRHDRDRMLAAYESAYLGLSGAVR
ncbi:MAG TPA: glycosyltransferase [Acidimicrobiales bacterium]|nr:glycosyltransferase [Acidimicrobiales bacterium]